jgi:Sulfotransferase domain
MFGSTRRKIDKLDFILIGAQKSGTTALHYLLNKHRRVCMGDKQEIHFFDDDPVFSRMPVDYQLLHRHYPRVGSETIAGDCTPSYLYHEPAAERISHYHPEIKLLVLLRNPVERAFAHWNMQRVKGREPLDFFEAVKQEKARISNAPPVDARRFAYVDRGFYARQLERYFKCFPREQMKIVKFEEFKEQPRETADAILSFLGLEPLRSMRNKDRNVVPYERVMNWQERVFCYSALSDDMAKLEQLLGWDCSDWKL